MKIITEWVQLQDLEESIDHALLEELKSYFKSIVTEMLEEDDYLSYDISEVAKIAVLETGDDIDHLPEIGFYEETIMLTESIAEFVDPLEIEGQSYCRIFVLLNDAEGVIIYAQINSLGEVFEKWVGEMLKL